MLKKVSVVAENFILNINTLSNDGIALVNLIDHVDGQEKDATEIVVSPKELRGMIGAMIYILEMLEHEGE